MNCLSNVHMYWQNDSIGGARLYLLSREFILKKKLVLIWSHALKFNVWQKMTAQMTAQYYR